MVNPPWLEELRASLASQELPQQYIERLVRELLDHHNDIKEESMNMESEKNSAADDRMGQPAQIAEAAAGEYHTRRSTARKGFLVCGWVIIVCAILAGIGTVPIKYSHGSANSGTMSVNSGLFATTVEGTGNFTYVQSWSISWVAAMICGATLAGGILLVRRNTAKIAPTA